MIKHFMCDYAGLLAYSDWLRDNNKEEEAIAFLDAIAEERGWSDDILNKTDNYSVGYGNGYGDRALSLDGNGHGNGYGYVDGYGCGHSTYNYRGCDGGRNGDGSGVDNNYRLDNF